MMETRLPLRVPSIDWTQAQVDQLSALWNEGVPTAEIAQRMALTKNQVTGKAGRITLPRRPSPIKAPRGSPLHGLTPAQRNLYLKLRRSGMTPFDARSEALLA
jgi:hypothetical protein